AIDTVPEAPAAPDKAPATIAAPLTAAIDAPVRYSAAAPSAGITTFAENTSMASAIPAVMISLLCFTSISITAPHYDVFGGIYIAFQYSRTMFKIVFEKSVKIGFL
ncbi:hypothetical protein, partial [Escherichia coli]|uniref:hypothetical protein n=1 Tax=Escherichia coli TaxID=562 RepID=UPI0019615EEE